MTKFKPVFKYVKTIRYGDKLTGAWVFINQDMWRDWYRDVCFLRRARWK